MLIIRAAQMHVLEQAALRHFEDEMVAHSRSFTPILCRVLGETQLRVALRQAMARAVGHGFTYRGPVRLYIEMMFLCGSDFDTDPQYPGVGEILRGGGDQMERAQALHEGVLDYQQKVAGPQGANVTKALRELSTLGRRSFAGPPDDFVPAMCQEMHRVFPERAAYIGDSGLMALIDEARGEARKHQFSTMRAQVLMVVLMFAFGHGCVNDPLYPWIARTLNDKKIIHSAARAQRLERKALTWLDHALARPQEDAAT
jgi:hypothetical protein